MLVPAVPGEAAGAHWSPPAQRALGSVCSETRGMPRRARPATFPRGRCPLPGALPGQGAQLLFSSPSLTLEMAAVREPSESPCDSRQEVILPLHGPGIPGGPSLGAEERRPGRKAPPPPSSWKASRRGDTPSRSLGLSWPFAKAALVAPSFRLSQLSMWPWREPSSPPGGLGHGRSPGQSRSPSRRTTRLLGFLVPMATPKVPGVQMRLTTA